AAKLALLEREDFTLLVFVSSAWVDDLLPAWQIVEPIGADLGGHAVMIELADACHEITRLPEELRQSDGFGNVIAKVRMLRPQFRPARVGDDVGGVGPAAGKKR